MLPDKATSLGALQARIWPSLLIVLLVAVLVPYFRFDLPIPQSPRSPLAAALLSLFPDIGMSFLVFAALRWPVSALAFFFATAPLANGLVAWVTLGDPGLHKQTGLFWVEPLFLSIAIGLLLRRVVSPEPAQAKRLEASVVFYSVVVLISLALAFRSGPGLSDGLSVAWLDIPRMDQVSPSHPLRAALLVLASLLWYRLTANQLRTSADIRAACRGWLVGGFLTGIYGIWIWIQRDRGFYKGIESVLDDPNSYASYLVLTLFISWGAFLTEAMSWPRRLALLTLIVTAWMLAVSGSRIAIIAATTCTGIAWSILAASARTRWRRSALLAGLACGVLLFSFLGGGYAPKEHPDVLSGSKLYAIHRFAQAMDPAFVLRVWREGRQAILVAGLRMVGERPAFGQGPGTFVSKLKDYYQPGDEGYKPPHENAHNYFVQAAAETGILGLVGFLWVVVSSLIAGFTRGPEQERSRARLLTIGLVAYLITSATGHPLLLPEQAFLFWGGIGLLRACSQLERKEITADLRTGSRPASAAL